MQRGTASRQERRRAERSAAVAGVLRPLIAAGETVDIDNVLNALAAESAAAVTACASCGAAPGSLAASGDVIKLRHCSGCRLARFCGRMCQSAQWSLHKPVCATLASDVAVLAGFDGLRVGARLKSRDEVLALLSGSPPEMAEGCASLMILFRRVDCLISSRGHDATDPVREEGRLYMIVVARRAAPRLMACLAAGGGIAALAANAISSIFYSEAAACELVSVGVILGLVALMATYSGGPLGLGYRGAATNAASAVFCLAGIVDFRPAIIGAGALIPLQGVLVGQLASGSGMWPFAFMCGFAELFTSDLRGTVPVPDAISAFIAAGGARSVLATLALITTRPRIPTPDNVLFPLAASKAADLLALMAAVDETLRGDAALLTEALPHLVALMNGDDFKAGLSAMIALDLGRQADDVIAAGALPCLVAGLSADAYHCEGPGDVQGDAAGSRSGGGAGDLERLSVQRDAIRFLSSLVAHGGASAASAVVAAGSMPVLSALAARGDRETKAAVAELLEKLRPASIVI